MLLEIETSSSAYSSNLNVKLLKYSDNDQASNQVAKAPLKNFKNNFKSCSQNCEVYEHSTNKVFVKKNDL